MIFSLSSLSLFGQYEPISEGEIVKHAYYTLSYNEKHEQANWVYYRLKTGYAKRTNDYRIDPMVRTGSALPEDYDDSGYQRGHLCPAASISLNKTSISESFYMSNIAPQYPGFKRGIWKKLETSVRKFGGPFETHVVTGPIFKFNDKPIGLNKVTPPGYFYKIVCQPKSKIMVAFVIPHEPEFENTDLSQYAVTVDRIEEATGIDFFSQLEDDLEDQLESEADTNIINTYFGEKKTDPAPAKTQAPKNMQKAKKVPKKATQRKKKS